jgi:hypothetical protein
LVVAKTVLSWSISTVSVNVPPMSIASRNPVSDVIKFTSIRDVNSRSFAARQAIQTVRVRRPDRNQFPGAALGDKP